MEKLCDLRHGFLVQIFASDQKHSYFYYWFKNTVLLMLSIVFKLYCQLDCKIIPWARGLCR